MQPLSARVVVATGQSRSATKAIQRSALPFEGVNNIHCGDCPSARVLGVRDGVADNVLEKDLQDAAGLVVNEPGDALDAAAPSQSSNRRLADALDGVAEHFAVALDASIAQTQAAFAAPCHLRPR